MPAYRLFCRQQGKKKSVVKHRFEAASPDQVARHVQDFLDERPDLTATRLMHIVRKGHTVEVALPEPLKKAA